jgi:hypothetical protein
MLAALIAIINQFYNHSIFLSEIEFNPAFERCIEITERAEKIFVLCLMPLVPLLILNRDDIFDCLLWGGAMSLLALITHFLILTTASKPKRKTSTKVEKIE